ncbi:MAG: hypothetical protein MZU97_10635 [Bacillus subtilis]|nr:hypothetical protein [Bacillus subtilis]
MSLSTARRRAFQSPSTKIYISPRKMNRTILREWDGRLITGIVFGGIVILRGVLLVILRRRH